MNASRALIAALLLSLTACLDGAHPPALSGEVPDVGDMQLAMPAAKATVPVDVRYRLEADPAPEQPVRLHLAIVPRVECQNLAVQFAPSDSVSVESGTSYVLQQQKAGAAEVYRRSVTVTPRTVEDAQVRVIVSMEMEGARAFGIFTMPFQHAPGSPKPQR